MTRGNLVTVGVASYNRPELLKRAIQSAVTQTYKNLEILISDNGSSKPEVKEIIEEFARSDIRIRCIFHPVNQGPFFNFSSVLNEATGDYFVWLADDDYWSPEYVEQLMGAALQSGAALTYGRCEIVDVSLPDSERVAKEMPTVPGALSAMMAFVRFDSDSIFYGLFSTATGKKLAGLLRNWHVSKSMAADYPFLEHNFVSYVFIFGLLSSGGFCNASSDRVVHYAGGRDPFSQSPSLGLRHLGLFLVYILIHVQMAARFAKAALSAGSLIGVLASPIAAWFLFSRRIGMIVFQRFIRLLRG